MNYLGLIIIGLMTIHCAMSFRDDLLWRMVDENDDTTSDNSFIGRALASDFLDKRTFFHPGKTRCEEEKREVTERYEEKCEHIIPMKRNCPDIKLWLVVLFKFHFKFTVFRRPKLPIKNK
jgi:hypothetical protein